MSFALHAALLRIRSHAVWWLALVAAVAAVVETHARVLPATVPVASLAVATLVSLDPLRTHVLVSVRNRRRGAKRKTPEFFAARREFARLWVARKTVLRGAGLTIKVTVGKDGQRSQKELFPRLLADFQSTERGLLITVSPLARHGQTVQAVVDAASRISANIGHDVVVSPHPEKPFEAALVAVLLRDPLEQVRQVTDSEDWFLTDLS